MKKGNLFLLIGATILLFAFVKKKKRTGTVEIGPLEGNQLVADAGAILFNNDYYNSILYNFKGGEWLQYIDTDIDDYIVEYVTPTGNRLRGYIPKNDVKILK